MTFLKKKILKIMKIFIICYFVRVYSHVQLAIMCLHDLKDIGV